MGARTQPVSTAPPGKVCVINCMAKGSFQKKICFWYTGVSPRGRQGAAGSCAGGTAWGSGWAAMYSAITSAATRTSMGQGRFW